ncbi:hypothetical protein IGI04_030107 [Brassica rapa subsp. trilocularis]|uniref:Uncharacterized protein n=1 Tax=Brassica rapa subsp. trilocularis TaxID=1813537 RepID=A0ABQ7LTQ4_BRACM|nr:hypothetical protein IGI04_030107 [Brassica rapa subsp. trilocularis]
MKENSNMVLISEYKKAKEQHKRQNMPRRSDLNLARNVIKEFEHPAIQGKTMYSSLSDGSNERGKWRRIDSTANTDRLATMKEAPVVETVHPDPEEDNEPESQPQEGDD